MIQQFGHNLKVLTSANPDDAVVNPLHDFGEIEIVPAEYTTTMQNIYSSEGRTQMMMHTAEHLMLDHLPQAWQSASLVHLAPLADDVDYQFATQFPDATVLLTPQGYMRTWGDDNVVHFKKFLDTGVLEAIDILVLSKQDIIDAPELEQEYPKYTKHVVVTNGENGGTYYHNGDSYHYDAVPATELDPTGAGDVFAASLLASLPMVNHNIPMALDVAAHIASIAVTVQGAKIPLSQTIIQQAVQKAHDNHD
ncbi:MAG: PfkB family carbohydrate kinase [Chloroflexota bacterium]